MGFTYFLRWRFVVFFVKYANHIPHRLWSGFASPFLVIRGAPPSSLKSHFSLPLKTICSIAQLFCVFTFLPQFLRKLICGLKFVISFSSVGVVR